jgi:hypothetical protein
MAVPANEPEDGLDEVLESSDSQVWMLAGTDLAAFLRASTKRRMRTDVAHVHECLGQSLSASACAQLLPSLFFLAAIEAAIGSSSCAGVAG